MGKASCRVASPQLKSRGDRTEPKEGNHGSNASLNKSQTGIRASFSNASLQIPRGKWRPSGAPEVPATDADADTPPALREARRQMSQNDDSAAEEQQNEQNAIKVDIR